MNKKNDENVHMLETIFTGLTVYTHNNMGTTHTINVKFTERNKTIILVWTRQ